MWLSTERYILLVQAVRRSRTGWFRRESVPHFSAAERALVFLPKCAIYLGGWCINSHALDPPFIGASLHRTWPSRRIAGGDAGCTDNPHLSEDGEEVSCFLFFLSQNSWILPLGHEGIKALGEREGINFFWGPELGIRASYSSREYSAVSLYH